MLREEGSVGHNVALNVKNQNDRKPQSKFGILLWRRKSKRRSIQWVQQTSQKPNQKVWERCGNLKMSKQELK